MVSIPVILVIFPSSTPAGRPVPDAAQRGECQSPSPKASTGRRTRRCLGSFRRFEALDQFQRLPLEQPPIDAARLADEIGMAALFHHLAGIETSSRSSARTVESRCAMTMVVRPCISRSIASWISISLSLSRLEVASSRISTRASARKARAMATLPLATRELDAPLAHQRVIAFWAAWR